MGHKAVTWARRQLTGSPSRKAVLLVLAAHANDLGVAWPSVRSVCRESELSERAVRKAISELAGAGLMTRAPQWRDNGSQKSTRFSLAMGAGDAADRVVQGGSGDAILVHPGVHGVQGEGAAGAPLTTFEWSEESLSANAKGGSRKRKANSALHADADRAFERFWRAYPRRHGSNPKKPACKEFHAAVKRGADPAAIIAGAERLGGVWANRPDDDRRFVPHARKWLRDEGWDDGGNETVVAETLADDDDRWAKRVASWSKTGTWASSWGPAPDQPDTAVPEQLRPAPTLAAPENRDALDRKPLVGSLLSKICGDLRLSAMAEAPFELLEESNGE